MCNNEKRHVLFITLLREMENTHKKQFSREFSKNPFYNFYLLCILLNRGIYTATSNFNLEENSWGVHITNYQSFLEPIYPTWIFENLINEVASYICIRLLDK